MTIKPTPSELRRAELKEAQSVVRTKRSALDAASANTARADALEKAARDKLAALEAERGSLHADLGGALATRIVNGLPDQPIATTTAIDAKVQAAVVHLAVHGNAASRLREIHIAAENGLRAAETAADKADNALADAENEEYAAEIMAITTVLNEKVERLKSRVFSRANCKISPDISKALAIRPDFNPLHVPVDKLRAMATRGENY